MVSPGGRRARSSPGELLAQPVGGERPVAVRDVVADVVAVVEEDELAARRLARDPLGLLPRDQAVEAAGDAQERLRDPLGDALEAQLGSTRACFLGRGGAGVVLHRLA